MANAFLAGYAGQSTEELLALENQYRIDSLVLAFEQAIQQKAAPLSREEGYVLAVEALEREVNNGGFSQFFVNTGEYVGNIVPALRAIACPVAAALTQDAIAGLQAGPDPSPQRVEAAIHAEDPTIEAALAACDDRYFANTEPIADNLFAWIKVNAHRIRVGAA